MAHIKPDTPSEHTITPLAYLNTCSLQADLAAGKVREETYNICSPAVHVSTRAGRIRDDPDDDENYYRPAHYFSYQAFYLLYGRKLSFSWCPPRQSDRCGWLVTYCVEPGFNVIELLADRHSHCFCSAAEISEVLQCRILLQVGWCNPLSFIESAGSGIVKVTRVAIMLNDPLDLLKISRRYTILMRHWRNFCAFLPRQYYRQLIVGSFPGVNQNLHRPPRASDPRGGLYLPSGPARQDTACSSRTAPRRPCAG